MQMIHRNTMNMKNVYVEVNEQYFWLNSIILTFINSDAWINETIIYILAYKIFYFFGLYVEKEIW